MKEPRQMADMHTHIQKSCDPPAIAAVDCGTADQLCHCQRQTPLLSNIIACADRTCADTGLSLYGTFDSRLSLSLFLSRGIQSCLLGSANRRGREVESLGGGEVLGEDLDDF